MKPVYVLYACKKCGEVPHLLRCLGTRLVKEPTCLEDVFEIELNYLFIFKCKCGKEVKVRQPESEMDDILDAIVGPKYRPEGLIT